MALLHTPCKRGPPDNEGFPISAYDEFADTLLPLKKLRLEEVTLPGILPVPAPPLPCSAGTAHRGRQTCFTLQTLHLSCPAAASFSAFSCRVASQPTATCGTAAPTAAAGSGESRIPVKGAASHDAPATAPHHPRTA